MRIRPAIALSAAALFAWITIVPASAGTSVAAGYAAFAAKHQSHYLEWRPGHRLPHIPTGYKLVAWPPSQVLKNLKPGQSVSLVSIRKGTRAQEIRRYKHLENKGGIVNLELRYSGKVKGANGAKAVVCLPEKPVFEQQLAEKHIIVAQSYSTIPNVTQSFHYGGGATSTFTVGISGSGDFGTFSAEGTTGVAAYTSWDFTPSHGRAFNHWRTDFQWASYYEQWAGAPTVCKYFDHYTDQPYQWDGGNYSNQASGAPNAPFCERVKRVDTITKKDSKASTIKAGFDIGGFSGSVQTGYSQDASIKFHFHLAKHQKAQLCGTVNKPGAISPGPGVLVASPRAGTE